MKDDSRVEKEASAEARTRSYLAKNEETIAKMRKFAAEACTRREVIDLRGQWCLEEIEEFLGQPARGEDGCETLDDVHAAVIHALERAYDAGRWSWLPTWLRPKAEP